MVRHIPNANSSSQLGCAVLRPVPCCLPQQQVVVLLLLRLRRTTAPLSYILFYHWTLPCLGFEGSENMYGVHQLMLCSYHHSLHECRDICAFIESERLINMAKTRRKNISIRLYSYAVSIWLIIIKWSKKHPRNINGNKSTETVTSLAIYRKS
jgi:hypothetical protein